MTEGILEKAILLLNQKRYDEAERLLGQLATQIPDDDYILYLLAEVQLQKDNFQRADELINNAIALNPEEGNHFYLKARVYLMQDKYREAEGYIKEAISLNPYTSYYFAIWAQINILQKKYEPALDIANQGLELDPGDVLCLNMRSTALLKLNRKEESYETIAGALNQDPNNAYTHSNHGWGLLEKGNPAKALEHFREALRNDPNSSHAQAGMIEALKAKFVIYRLFLQYSFWMSNKAAKYQWFFILGFYFGTKALRRIADNNEALQPFLYPLIGLLFLFAFSTWIITPISNLFLRFNIYGRHLLDREEKITSTIIGACILTSLLSGISYLVTSMPGFITLAAFMFTMMIPLSNLFTRPKGVFYAYNGVMALLGILAVSQAFATGEVFSVFAFIYVIGLVAFQFITNYFVMRTAS